jgi:exonuclease SbcC
VALKDLDDVREMLDETAECIDELTEATGQLSGLVGKAQQAAEGLATALAREGFSREPEVAAGLLDEDTLDALGECVQVDVARSERMLELRAVVGEAPVPKHRPDLDMLEEAAEIAAAALEQAGDRATTLANAVETLERRGEALTTLGSDVASLVERAIRAKHIADVVNRGEGEILGLERWVQRAVFEEVCQVATEQIRALSHGRYVLTLDATGQPQRKRAAGLDLFVTDSHTGRTRRVQSLSGGEQFLTSLALALALAEVVQNRSGGIELSTLFIDEGFGSLDGDTLDTAVEVLRSLQDNGRTVGLISHVDAMKQELPVGIQVTPSQTGSSITCPSLAA